MIEIETGVPIPDHPSNGRPSKYPFARMAPGDSFAVPEAETVRLGSAAKIWKRRHPGWDYRTSKQGAACRLWRIA